MRGTILYGPRDIEQTRLTGLHISFENHRRSATGDTNNFE